MATAVTESARATKTTIVKEEIAAPSAVAARTNGKSRRETDFWELVGSLTDADWKSYLVRVYRADDNWERAGAPENNKIFEPFDEETIRNRFGGGRYTLWLYQDSQLIYPPFKLELEGRPKIPNPSSTGPSTIAAGDDQGPLITAINGLIGELRSKNGGETAQDAMRSAMALNAEALRTGVDAARSALSSAQPPAVPVDQEEKFLQKLQLYKNLFASETKDKDPMEVIKTFGAMLGAMKEFMAGSVAGGGGGGDALSTLLAQAPTLGKYVVEGMREARMTSEMNYKIAIAQRGGVPPNIPSSQVIDVSAETGRIPNPAPGETPADAAPGGEPKVINGPSPEWVYLRIVELVRDPRTEGEDLLRFLDNVKADSLVNQISQLSRDQIIMLFKAEPILATVAEDPRLPQLIDEFLAAVKEDAEPAVPTKLN